MEFKIDTKLSYTLLSPLAEAINANLTEAISQKCKELTNTGSNNFIIDLQHCLNAEQESLPKLADLHETCYNNSQSLVFIGIQENILKQIKEMELDYAINIVPTLIEAVDIISMEILERDLFNEE